MADFMSAVRASTNRLADIQRRKARLAGRTLTKAEQAAPYAALAQTAGDRLAQQKQIQNQERNIDVTQSLGERRLEQESEQSKLNAELERQRLADARMNAERQLSLQRDQMDAQLMAAQQAREADKKQQTMQLATLGTGIALKAISSDLGKSILSGIGSIFKGLF